MACSGSVSKGRCTATSPWAGDLRDPPPAPSNPSPTPVEECGGRSVPSSVVVDTTLRTRRAREYTRCCPRPIREAARMDTEFGFSHEGAIVQPRVSTLGHPDRHVLG